MTHDELGKLYETQYNSIKDYAMTICNNEHDAEDIASETFLRATENIGNIDTKGANQYLRRTAHNIAVDYYRLNSKQKAVDFNDLPESDCDNPDYEQLFKSLQSLPAKQSWAIYYYFYQHMDYEHIAHEMGCSVDSVKGLLKRAKHNLRQLMVGHDEQD